ncbi:MAG: BPL-N domain-containing protein [Pirellulaceae bacterium]
MAVYYGQGPLLVPGDVPDLPRYEVLASYAGEVVKNGALPTAMPGTHAIIRSTYGQGRVICFSPHPETSSGPNHLMASGVRWAAPRNRTTVSSE